MNYTVHRIQYTVISIQYTVYNTQYTVYSIQYIVYQQYAEYSVVGTVHRLQYHCNHPHITWGGDPTLVKSLTQSAVYPFMYINQSQCSQGCYTYTFVPH